MALDFIKEFILNEEQRTPDNKLFRAKLNYTLTDLDPVISEETMDYHYGKLYKSYVDRYNAGEGDLDFNEAGAFLHNIFFVQFTEPKSSNLPADAIKEFIDQHYESYDKFKDAVQQEAMSIQGSGWVYLSRNGQIKTIKNHAKRSDILLLIDWWEHAWALDYQADKQKYLDNIWKIIDWNVISQRMVK